MSNDGDNKTKPTAKQLYATLQAMQREDSIVYNKFIHKYVASTDATKYKHYHGITTPIKELYFSNKQLKSKTDEKKEEKKQSKKKKKHSKHLTEASTPVAAATTDDGEKKLPKGIRGLIRKGMMLGTRIDKEMTQWVTHMRENDISLDRVLFEWIELMKAKRSLPVHLRTLNIFAYYKKMDLTPIVCQLAVSSAKSGFATQLDCLCYNHANSRFVNTQIKSGYKQSSYTSSRYVMPPPFDNKLQSKYNEHQIQALVEYVLAKSFYGFTSSNFESIIIRVTDDCVHPYTLESWVFEHEALIASHFVSSSARSNQKSYSNGSDGENKKKKGKRKVSTKKKNKEKATIKKQKKARVKTSTVKSSPVKQKLVN